MDNYMLLRRLILDSATYDAISATTSIRPYFERIDNGEDALKVLKDYARVVTNNKSYVVKVNGINYRVGFNSQFKSKIAGVTPGKDHATKAILIKRLLVCLANLDEVLVNGAKTHLIPDDGHVDARGKRRHPEGTQWIYAKETCEEHGLKGEVIVQIKFPPTITNQSKSLVYTINTEGTNTFRARRDVFEANKDLDGTVTISLG